MPKLRSSTSSTFARSAGSVKLGQPVPESNFVPDENNSAPHPAHRYVPERSSIPKPPRERRLRALPAENVVLGQDELLAPLAVGLLDALGLARISGSHVCIDAAFDPRLAENDSLRPRVLQSSPHRPGGLMRAAAPRRRGQALKRRHHLAQAYEQPAAFVALPNVALYARARNQLPIDVLGHVHGRPSVIPPETRAIDEAVHTGFGPTRPPKRFREPTSSTTSTCSRFPVQQRYECFGGATDDGVPPSGGLRCSRRPG